MHIRRALCRVVFGILGVLSYIGAVWGGGYTITDLGTLGGDYSAGKDVNQAGWVVGNSRLAGDTKSRAFLYDGTTMQDLGTLGGEYALATAVNSLGKVAGSSDRAGDETSRIFLFNGVALQDLGNLGHSAFAGGMNDSGVIVGSSYLAPCDPDVSYDPTCEQHAFVYDGIMRDLGTLGGYQSWAADINATGQIVGSSYLDVCEDPYNLDTCPEHVFLHDGQMHDLGTMGGAAARANAINDAGQITGTSQYRACDAWDLPCPTHAFIYADGVWQDLGVLFGSEEVSEGHDINNHGQVVGRSWTDANGGGYAAFLYDENGMHDLCLLANCTAYGWTRLYEASSINDLGEITGSGQIDGQTHAFLIQPHDGPLPEICDDGIDNDEDGQIDCADSPECDQAPLCYKPPGMDYALIDLGTLGGLSSNGYAINELGQVAGDSQVSGSALRHAFLFDGFMMRDLGVLPGGDESWATDINQYGHVSGFGKITTGPDYPVYRAFLHNGVSLRDLGVLPCAPDGSSKGYGVNNAGDVAGLVTVSLGDPWGGSGHAFVHDGAVMNDIGTLGGEDSSARDINNLGQIVGVSELSGTNVSHAFLYHNGNWTDLGTLGEGWESTATRVSENGLVTGHSEVNADYPQANHAFLHDGNDMHDLGTFGGWNSYGYGVNNAGHVVGASEVRTGGQRAFLHDGERMLDLCRVTDCVDRGWTILSAARDINNRGDITGSGIVDGQVHAFLALNLNDPPLDPEICDDGIDNDGDGLIDCEDTQDCEQAPNCYVPPQPEICDDGIDNDGDGLVDCLDKKDCRQHPACKTGGGGGGGGGSGGGGGGGGGKNR